VPPAGNIYAAAGANMLAPAVAGMPSRIYVPQSAGRGIYVIDPATFKVIDRYPTGLDPQHVVPAWDLKTLYVTNDLDNSLTPIDPFTAKPSGPNISVADPYNLYFTPDGTTAIVVAEAQSRLDFRDAHSFALLKALPVGCPGVDHIDFSADGSYLVATCEFSAQLVEVDLRSRAVVGYLKLADSSPQDIKLDPAGRVFYVADRNRGGVHQIDAATFREIGFLPTGKDTHGLYPSRDARFLYVTNRGSGSVTVVDFATGRPRGGVAHPGGPQPRHGRRLGRWDRAVAVGSLRRSDLRDLDARRASHRPGAGTGRAAWALRLAPARALLARAHWRDALTSNEEENGKWPPSRTPSAMHTSPQRPPPPG
jgi:hypothetical protein